MERIIRIVVFSVVSAILGTSSIFACSLAKAPVFEEIAPTAKYIFAFRVLSLEVKESEREIENGRKTRLGYVEGKIAIEANIKGSANTFNQVIYEKSFCGGLVLQVGHRYLIAINQSGPTSVLALAYGDQSIADIDPNYLLPLPSIESNRYVSAARRAVNGSLSYSEVLDESSIQGTSSIPFPGADIKPLRRKK